MMKKTLVGLGLAAVLVGASACTADDATPDGEQEQSDTALEPDLAGVPEIVAEVDGTEIDRDEFASAYEAQFAQAAQQAQMSGTPVDQEQLKQQTVETLVNSELLIQEADRRGYDATADDVDATLEELAAQNQLESVDAFLDALEEQGTSEDEVRTQVEEQVRMEQVIDDEVGTSEPSDEELRELYDQIVEQQEQSGGEEMGEIPPFEDVRDQLAQQQQQTEEQEAVTALLADLEADAEVEIFL
ncbi:SurA N-terminal domain-containing protein [Microbacterium sp. LRZ72]|uniref:SurA N-terminal domain-containing protein n=1 Tax=Microbacterium sp. LRZ72 TaxID=2942481 RepID=UPI0029BA972C|nr:SurA N-terminal domain-containing protein [Microbacterium sp. LRZ72]MDX2375299.1 SurA N-terminal domain-containing protein [Microbacterium sp. LRZ72]